MLEIKSIQQQARDELKAERSKLAIEKLKDLYIKEEKALLVLKNIRREIVAYTEDLDDEITYSKAGIDKDGKL